MWRYLVIAISFAAMVCSLTESQGLLFAQDESEYSYGTVSGVSAGKIVVKEYDYDQEDMVDVTYSFDPQVKLDNITALEDIEAGDKVWFDYVVRGDQKTILSIEVRKPSFDEYAPSEEPEESMPDVKEDVPSEMYEEQGDEQMMEMEEDTPQETFEDYDSY